MTAPSFISSTATAFNTGTTPKTTASIAVQNGDVLVASLYIENAAATVATISTATGSTSAWTTKQEPIGIGTTANQSYIKTSTATATATGNITVSFARTAAGGQFFGGVVKVWRGSGGIGNTNSANSGTGTGSPTVSVTTTGANSGLDFFSDDWAAVAGTVTFTASSGTPVSDVADQTSSGTNYCAYSSHVVDASAIGSKSMGMSAPTAQRYVSTIVEILGSGASVGISGIGWFEPPDHPRYGKPVRDHGSLPAYVRPPTVFTPVSGISWQGPRDHVKLPPKASNSEAPAYGRTPFGAVSTISGIAWYEPPADKPAVKVSQDTAPPAFGKAPFTVPGVAWTEPPDRDRLPVRVSQDSTPPAFGQFVPAVGISGNGWFLPLEIGQPKAKVASDPPAFGRPFTASVPISGIAWDTLHENDILPKGKYLTDPVAVPYAPQTSTWSFLVGDTTFIRDAPIDIPPTMGTTPTAAVTVPVSGIAWYTQTDQTKVRVSFDQPPAHVLRPFAAVNTNAGIPWFEPPDRDRPATKIWIEAFPAIQLRPTSLISGIGWFEPPDVDKKPVRINGEAQPGFAVVPPPVPISGMAWYEPADRDRPVLKVSIESSPAFAVFAPAPPVGVSGMAWFAPKPDSVVVQVSFSQAPALQQPIVQLVPPPDDGTRGSETILTDRRGAGQFTRRQYDEFLKAKRAAEHKARLLKKKPGAELRRAVEVAEEAVAKAGLLGDIAPSIEPITDALFDAADANVAQVAAEAREAIRVAEALLLQMDEEREEEAVLMLLLTS